MLDRRWMHTSRQTETPNYASELPIYWKPDLGGSLLVEVIWRLQRRFSGAIGSIVNLNVEQTSAHNIGHSIAGLPGPPKSITIPVSLWLKLLGTWYNLGKLFEHFIEQTYHHLA